MTSLVILFFFAQHVDRDIRISFLHKILPINVEDKQIIPLIVGRVFVAYKKYKIY